ncbi:putative dehydrogenase [Sphingopyxis panaciterrulae]|uniref:Putative dehydrogenase n=1 Tax=Sphingopyxis panaciterrulae TaxID=462372 RepID=A0A7W9B735_9SPHN|nr:putative dehydrogenase [Sphingopyxis panaciterrulae]
MTGKLKVGVVSANWGMRAHLPAWHATGGAEVVAVCTARRETAEAAARDFGVARPYWDAFAMCADPDLDIIDIGTRPDLRMPMVLAALEHGKHVFASANFAPDLTSARRMRDAARAAGTVCALDSVFAWQAAHRQVKRLVETGTAGTPFAVNARLHISHFATPTAGGSGWRWFGVKKHGASAMRNLGTHSLHLLTWLLGPVEAVVGQTMIARKKWVFDDGTSMRPEVDDTAQLLLRFASGAMGTLALGWSSPGKSGWQMEISGQAMTLMTRDDQGFACGPRLELLGAGNGDTLQPLQIDPDLAEPAGLFFSDTPAIPQIYDIAPALQQMLRAIREGGVAVPDFEAAFHVEAILDAALRSSETGQWASVLRD